MYRRLETPDVLHSRTVCLHGLHVLVENGKDLVVKYLILSDAVGHLLQWLQIINITDYHIKTQNQRSIAYRVSTDIVDLTFQNFQ